MTVMENEDPADPSAHEPRVTGSPEAIWLVYGDLERDDTHANCCAEGEVTWCEDAQFAADVRYTRTDRVSELVRAAVAAERERLDDLLRRYQGISLETLECLEGPSAQEWAELDSDAAMLFNAEVSGRPHHKTEKER